MEKSFVNDFYRFIKEDEFLCQNMRQISTQIKKIKKKFFDNQKEFNIIVYYFKKISKDSTIVQIIINRYMFELTFDFTFLTKETRKEQRLNFSSNLLDEIIDNFLKSFHFTKTDFRNKIKKVNFFKKLVL